MLLDSCFGALIVLAHASLGLHYLDIDDSETLALGHRQLLGHQTRGSELTLQHAFFSKFSLLSGLELGRDGLVFYRNGIQLVLLLVAFGPGDQVVVRVSKTFLDIFGHNIIDALFARPITLELLLLQLLRLRIGKRTALLRRQIGRTGELVHELPLHRGGQGEPVVTRLVILAEGQTQGLLVLLSLGHGIVSVAAQTGGLVAETDITLVSRGLLKSVLARLQLINHYITKLGIGI